jgi:hypothetical protein
MGKLYKFIPFKVPVGFVQAVVKIPCITPNHYAHTKSMDVCMENEMIPLADRI